MNRQAAEHRGVEREIAIVRGATHLFEEPGTLEQAARLARDWFHRFLTVATDRVHESGRESERTGGRKRKWK